ncbi:MAG TPA: sigma-54 dependent transcriptional regulator [Phycisphaerae bacterium]|nr:sigma-54 dependent transcriptional regulator [Phycisphaerae bacterium]
MAKPAVVIIEDEATVRETLAQHLVQHGCRVETAPTAEEGLGRVAEGETDVVILDYRLPDADGLEVLDRMRRQWPEVPTIFMTGFTDIEVAIQAMQRGAFDYVSKPFSADEMLVVVDKALEARRLRSEVNRIRSSEARQFGFERVVARSPAMLQIIHLLRHLAESEPRTILLQGESGTGKDLAAKAIHYGSRRAQHPFMNITCTALPETLLESELFGHEKGAFTDARQQKKGLFELADGGTIYLDEIGDMPPSLQAKLLRFLEEKAFRRVGGTEDLHVDVRIIAATHRDLRSLVQESRFREDLFYRLNVLPVTLPPLRDRPEDIPLLADYFIAEYNREFHKDLTGVEPTALAIMKAYRWPGNVRELKNVIERTMLLASSGRVTLANLPDELREPAPAREPEGDSQPVVRLGPDGVDLEEVERQLVEQALERTGGNKTRAAALLHMSRDQLRYRIQKYHLEPGGD